MTRLALGGVAIGIAAFTVLALSSSPAPVPPGRPPPLPDRPGAVVTEHCSTDGKFIACLRSSEDGRLQPPPSPGLSAEDIAHLDRLNEALKQASTTTTMP